MTVHAKPRRSAPCVDLDSSRLRYVTDQGRGLSREKREDAFVYRRVDGRLVTDEKHLARIRALAIPPAWTDVWICPNSNGHIQATGRDARGRKQYRYHAGFRAIRESAKFERMIEFARVLPRIRTIVDAHMKLPGLPREKVLATVVHLLETTFIRIGNDDYARANGSYGLTTLRARHVKVEGSGVRFKFRGKSGKDWLVTINSRRVARIIRSCQELPGQDLLQYVDEEGEARPVGSSDVNAYLREISGLDVSTKDFRTWGGTVMAAVALCELEISGNATEAKRNVRKAVQKVASRLGNTPAVCRKCYIHPDILSSYTSGELQDALHAVRNSEAFRQFSGLSLDEAKVIAFLAFRTMQAAA